MTTDTHMSREERAKVLTAIAEGAFYVSRTADGQRDHDVIRLLEEAYAIVSKLGYYTEKTP